jgi:predicted hotdog family 3-hydroxylacyl-ACP dehydratase
MNHISTLDHAGIAARIPHSGSMCLLHRLLGWSPDEIRCSAIGHADATNPLRSASGLHAAVAIEYASQAMALHGTLSAAPGTPPVPGFLASVRGVKLHVPRLDEVPGELRVTAQRLAGDSTQAMYSFTLHGAAGALLVEGRATVILNATLAPTA